MSGRVLAVPFGFESGQRRDLWIPEHSANDRHGLATCPPEEAARHKMVIWKYRLTDDGQWLGPRFVFHAQQGEDLDAVGADGLSWRDQIYRQLVGIIEAATKGPRTPDGIFVHHDSDEMQGRTHIDQWPELEHCQERYDAFVRYVPPKRDSPQVLEAL